MKYAVIDVGSNTIRLAVYAVEGKKFTLLFSQKDTVGLAGYIQSGIISQNGIHKACETLLKFRMLLQQFQVEQAFAFATASLRNIHNTQEAIHQIFLLTGYTIDVISGQTEAYLDYYGILHEVPLESGLLFDIGGGSTELVTFAHDGPGIIESLPIGSLNLTCKYVEKLVPKQKEREQIQERIQKEFKKHKLNHFPSYPILCGIGGTIRTILKLVQVQQGIPETQRTISTKQLHTLSKALWKKDHAAQQLLQQNCPDRLHTIYTGMILVNELVQLTQCDAIYVSQSGVREGYLRRELFKLTKD